MSLLMDIILCSLGVELDTTRYYGRNGTIPHRYIVLLKQHDTTY
jgi:hypothetical protein